MGDLVSDYATIKRAVDLFNQGADPEGIAKRYKVGTKLLTEYATGKRAMPPDTTGTLKRGQDRVYDHLCDLMRATSVDLNDLKIAQAALGLPDFVPNEEMMMLTGIKRDAMASSRKRLRMCGFFQLVQAEGKKQFYVVNAVSRKILDHPKP